MKIGKYQVWLKNPFSYKNEVIKVVSFRLPVFHRHKLTDEWKKIYEWWYHVGYISIRKLTDESAGQFDSKMKELLHGDGK